MAEPKKIAITTKNGFVLSLTRRSSKVLRYQAINKRKAERTIVYRLYLLLVKKELLIHVSVYARRRNRSES